MEQNEGEEKGKQETGFEEEKNLNRISITASNDGHEQENVICKCPAT